LFLSGSDDEYRGPLRPGSNYIWGINQMKFRICNLMALLQAVSLALPTVGQTPAAKPNLAMRNPAPAATLPYMAEYRILRIQSLPDRIFTHETRIVTASDSEGRKMTATTEIPDTPGEPQKTHFQVFNPVAHTTFSWNSPSREATVMAIPISGAIAPGCSFSTFGISYSNEKTTEEDLGTKTIFGIEAKGRRFSTTALIGPVGKRKKHQQPARTIQVRSGEIWQAVDAGLKGLVVRDVSGSGPASKTSKELVNFSQSEPEAKILQPPAGYQLVNREVNANSCDAKQGLNP
jgi:hypothetical protein